MTHYLPWKIAYNWAVLLWAYFIRRAVLYGNLRQFQTIEISLSR